MSRFPVDPKRLTHLSATRGGQVALSGFEYQRAFAVLRLVSMLTGQTVRGAATEVPVWLRYEWAEDIDELGADGKVTLWQCKIGTGWTGPSKLAEVLAGFAPKWLWTPPSERHMLQFRLVTSDPAYAAHGELPGNLPSKKDVRTAFLKELGTTAGAKSDRAQWQGDADTADHATLFEALWAATQVLYVPERDTTRPQSAWPAEDEALKVLALARRLGQHAALRDALQALRALLGADALAADAQGNVQRAAAEPLGLRPIDVADRLYAFSPPADHPAIPFTLVDSTTLRGLRDAPAGNRFVARRPDWADVVRGPNADVGFFERTLTDNLVDRLRKALSDCRTQAGQLRLQWLVGAPGAGKSTLALRAAALLVSEGACTAIDARFSLPEVDDVDNLVAEWQRLATSQRPLLLVLDDPLVVGSQWPDVLRKLSRGKPAIVVLAATPDFLLKKHRHELRDVAPLPDLPLPKPDPSERATLAAMYPGLDQALLAGDDELLVITMQANAGVNFDDIIRGIWRTLADGMALSEDTLVSDLPWEVAAFWLVVFFHRAYAPCPLPLLQGVLAERGTDGKDMVERMRQLTHAQPHGWRIFQIDAPQARFSYTGAAVRAMHARVAQRAWELRPAAHWKVADVIARASVAQYQSARRVAEALVALQQVDPATAQPVVAAVADAWSDTRNAALEARCLCELVAVWSRGLGESPAVLTRALQFQVDKRDAQSWLAALQLLYGRAGRQQPCSASLALPYTELIDAADFSLAPNRASKFANAISDDAAMYLAFQVRLWKAFDGLLQWRLDGFLLTWLLARAVDADIRQRLEVIRAWLRAAPDDTTVRTKFLGHLPKLPAEEQSNVREEYRAWLTEHPDDTSVRSAFLGHLPKLSAEEQPKLLRDYRAWLTAHPDNTNVREKFLAMLVDHPALATDADFQDGIKFVELAPANGNVGAALITLLASKSHPALPRILKGLLKAIPSDRQSFTPACAALPALDCLGARHLLLTLRWLAWAAEVLEAHHADRSAQAIAGSIGVAVDAANRQAAQADSDGALRQCADKVIARVSAARTAWNRSVGYNRYIGWS